MRPRLAETGVKSTLSSGFRLGSLHLLIMAPKKNADSRATLVIQSAMKDLAADEHRDAVNYCHSQLLASKELAMRVQCLIKTGALQDAKEPDKNFLIPSSNKWHLLKAEVLQSILLAMANKRQCTAAELQQLKTIAKKTELLRLLCFLLNADPQSAVYSKHIPTLTERCCRRLASLPERSFASILQCTDAGHVQWEFCGVFWVDNAAKVLYHTDGPRVPLRADLQTHKWTLVLNLVVTMAKFGSQISDGRALHMVGEKKDNNSEFNLCQWRLLMPLMVRYSWGLQEVGQLRFSTCLLQSLFNVADSTPDL